MLGRLAIFQFSLLILLTNRCATGQSECPSRCLCFRTTVRCMFLHLNAVPEHIPAKTTVLDLRFNRIKAVPSHTFRRLKHLNTLLLNNNQVSRIEDNAFLGLKELRYLYLYKNRIRTVSKHGFRGLPKLEQLYMHFNKIQNLEEETFSNLPVLERLFLHHNQLTRLPRKAFQKLESLRRLRLDSNALICDCELLWLVEMLDEAHQRHHSKDSVQAAATCHGPQDLTGRSLTQVTRDDFHCRRPHLLQEPRDVEVSFGGTAYFHCQAEGDPDPNITWYHNSNEILPNRLEDERLSLLSEGATLMITSAKEGDQGLYECMARNSAGETKSRAAHMKYKDKEEHSAGLAPEIVVKPTDQSATVGSEAIFQCQFRGQPAPEISWMGNRGSIGGNGDNNNIHVVESRFRVSPSGALSISPVRIEDVGNYRCLASNHLGRATAGANLVIHVPAQISEWPYVDSQEVGAGLSVDLTCRAGGYPTPNITWMKDGRLLDPGGHSLILNEGSLLRLVGAQVNVDDGLYSCQAQNQAGTDTRQIWIRVASPDEPSLTFAQDRNLPRSVLLESSVSRAHHEVDRAMNATLAELFETRNASSLGVGQFLRAFRFPDPEAREMARAGEIFSRAMELLQARLAASGQNTSAKEGVSPFLKLEEIHLLANLSGCFSPTPSTVETTDNSGDDGPCQDWCFHSQYRTPDGRCNNLQRPDWGAALTAFRRLLPPHYEDDLQAPLGFTPSKLENGYVRPNARLVSRTAVMTKDVTPDPDYSHMLMQWGQFLDHDLDFSMPAVSHSSFSDGSSCLSGCSVRPPCFPILIPQDDIARPNSQPNCIEFVRSSALCGTGIPSLLSNQTLTREQVNQLTSFLDASNVYGSSHHVSQLVRDRSSTGLLRTSRHGGIVYLPFAEGFPMDCQLDRTAPSVPCFLAGDVRANEQLGLLAMHTVWVREHNRLAGRLARLNPHWSAEKVYLETRKMVGAIMQHVTYQHWLPKILGPAGMDILGPYKGYNPDLDPSVLNVFATAVLRFGHTLINPVLSRLGSNWTTIAEGPLPLHKAFFAPHRLLGEGGVDPLLRGLAGAPAKLRMAGQLLNEELIDKLFTLAREVSLDLGAINIQRGRDHGIPGYSRWRRFCNLSQAEGFQGFAAEIRDSKLRRKLKELYGHPDNVDLWVGGVSEELVEGARVGPTFRCLLIEQFRRLRDGDRFWYENPGVFSPAQLTEIRRSSLAGVLCSSGDSMTEMTPDVFLVPARDGQGSNPIRDCKQLPRIQLHPWKECCAAKECSLSSNPLPNRRHQRSTNTEPAVVEPLLSRRERQVERTSNISDWNHQSALDASDARVEGLEEMLRHVNKRMRQMTKRLRRLQKDQCVNQGDTVDYCLDPKGQRRLIGETWSTDQTCQVCTCKLGGHISCHVTSPCLFG